ncbi:MAG: DUF4293 domain-containing protein [Flavobacteriales bacterium]
MWQRKQSFFLLLAGLACLSTWLFPVRTFDWGGKDNVTFMTRGIFDDEGVEVTDASLSTPYHILFSVLGGVFLVAIALFKNRPRQVRVVRSAWLVMLAVGVLQFIAGNSLKAYLERSGEVHSIYGISFFLPLLIIVLAFLAERAIRADEDLVKSMDRLR